MENKEFYIASVDNYKVTEKDFKELLYNNIVKVILFDEKYSNISSDTTIHEIHKFKSKYRGNTYIRVQIKVTEKNGIRHLEVDNSKVPTGFIVVSKHDLKNIFKEIGLKKKSERLEYGKTLCLQHMVKLNKMLSDEYLHLVIKNNEDNVLVDEFMWGDFDDVNDYISARIKDLEDGKIDVFQMI